MDITTPFSSPLLNSTEQKRLLSSIVQRGDCWVWTGALTNGGYGQTYALGGKWATHRLSYTLVKGAIESGKHLDHLCRNRACFRPDHLEQVTNRENVVVRGTGITAQNAKKTHCPRGHEYDYISPGDGKRHCMECFRINKRASRARRKAAGLRVT